MYPAQFDYYRASSVAEALSLLQQHDGAKLLAGGHSLLPMMKLRLAQPTALVDIGRVAELKGIEAADGLLRIGALTPHAAVASSALVRERCSLLAEAAAKIGDPQVRNRGTVGGNIAHADPASDLPAVLVALGATVVLRGPGHETGAPRRVAAASFFLDLLTTDLRAGEILTAVEIPTGAPGTGSCYLKVEHPASGYAICGAAAVLTLAGGRIEAAALCFNGVAPVPVNARGVAAALVGQPPDDSQLQQAMAHLAVPDPLDDIHASGSYRVHLARVYGQRALQQARDRAAS